MFLIVQACSDICDTLPMKLMSTAVFLGLSLSLPSDMIVSNLLLSNIFKGCLSIGMSDTATVCYKFCIILNDLAKSAACSVADLTSFCLHAQILCAAYKTSDSSLTKLSI